MTYRQDWNLDFILLKSYLSWEFDLLKADEAEDNFCVHHTQFETRTLKY